jgi:hypothetical protein
MWKSLQVMNCSFSQLVDIFSLFKLLSVSFLMAFFVEFSIEVFGFNNWFVVYSAPFYLVIVFLIGWQLGLLPEPVRDHVRSWFSNRLNRFL